jgi:uncharacterized membrane protein
MISERLQQAGKEMAAPSAGTVVACGAALASLVPVVLHQLGAVAHLPDPPGKIFDSDGITESKAAHPFGVPDGLLGMGSYAATLTLLVVARRQPKARPLLAMKLAGDAAFAGFNVARQLVQFRRICSWCTVTALATGVMVCAGRNVLKDRASEARRIVK